jgi:PAS domain S-box-containing protein
MAGASTPFSVSAFPALIESAPDGIVIVNQEGRIVLVNSKAEKLFGYERKELFDQPSEFLVPARFRERHRKYRASLVSDPNSQSARPGLDLFGL